VLVLGRALDLLGTYCDSPGLGLETNAWMGKLGWRGTLLVNVLFVAAVGVLSGAHTWIWLGVFSALLGARNAQLAWVPHAVGEERYRSSLDRWLRTGPLPTLLASLLLEASVWVLVGAAVADGSILATHPRLWYLADVGKGILFFGVFLLALRAFELFRVRRS